MTERELISKEKILEFLNLAAHAYDKKAAKAEAEHDHVAAIQYTAKAQAAFDMANAITKAFENAPWNQ